MRSRQRAGNATDAVTTAQLFADSNVTASHASGGGPKSVTDRQNINLGTNSGTAATPDANCYLGGQGINIDADDEPSSSSSSGDVGGSPDEADRCMLA